ncbi:MAG: hypothetical protein WCF12_16300 [Propionicimonas sp.]
MGSVLHPVGPEEPRVYWIRRAAVVGVAVLLIVALWWIWPKPQTVSAVPEISPLASAGTPSALATPSMTAAGSPSASPTPTGPQPCQAASVRLSIVGFQKVKVSAKQVFTLTATNTGTDPCVLTISPDTSSVTVSSGNDRIWSTADCDKWLPAKKMTLKSQATHEFSVTWPLRRSSSVCKLSRPKLAPGTYVAKAVFAEVSTAQQAMVLTK